MNTKQRFSLRKYKIGAVSVLLGTLLFMGGVTTTSADAVTNDSSVASLVQSASAQEAPPLPLQQLLKKKPPLQPFKLCLLALIQTLREG